MPLSDLLNAGLDFGGPVLEQVKNKIAREQRQIETNQWMTAWLKNSRNFSDEKRLANATHLYLSSTSVLDMDIARSLLDSDRKSLVGLGFFLAAAYLILR